jgi:hypothetical protein
MFKKLLLSLIIAIPVVAQADWIKVADGSEYTYSLDPNRIVSTSDSLKYAEAWVKMVIDNDLTKDGLSVGDYKLAKYKFKCDTTELGLVGIYLYKKSGQLFDSYKPSYVAYEPAIPDTHGERLLEVVCDYLYNNQAE